MFESQTLAWILLASSAITAGAAVMTAM
jgi:hypothetical protein